MGDIYQIRWLGDLGDLGDLVGGGLTATGGGDSKGPPAPVPVELRYSRSSAKAFHVRSGIHDPMGS